METKNPVIEHFGDLLVFTRVAETKSLSESARRLGTTKSAVSKQLRRLENALGAKLLNRTTRQMSLTETGVAVYERAIRISEEASALCNVVDDLQGTPRGTLRVTTSVAFGNMHLSRLICRFLVQYPDIKVKLDLRDRYVDVVDEAVDVAIRLTSKPMESFVARRLTELNYVVCATPAYLAAHPPIRAVEDLASHNCLSYEQRTDGDVWHFEHTERQLSVRVQGNLTVNSSESLREAVHEGIGIALLPTFAVGDDLQAGRLVALLPDFRAQGSFGDYVYAIFGPSKFTAPKVRVFVEFLAQTFTAGAYWDRPLLDVPYIP